MMTVHTVCTSSRACHLTECHSAKPTACLAKIDGGDAPVVKYRQAAQRPPFVDRFVASARLPPSRTTMASERAEIVTAVLELGSVAEIQSAPL